MILEGIILGIILSSKSKPKDGAVEGPELIDPWTRFDSLFQRYGAIYGVDWKILKAIALNESDLGRESSVAWGINQPADAERSKSSDGKSWGLMQITLSTASDFDSDVSPERLNNPEYSINIASQLLARLSDSFLITDARRLEWIVKSYNQGIGNTMKEQRGEIRGYAGKYWERFQRNLERVG